MAYPVYTFLRRTPGSVGCMQPVAAEPVDTRSPCTRLLGMSVSKRLWAGTIAGAAGAAAVNVAHEITRHVTPEAPRMDVVGMRGLVRLSRAAGTAPPAELRSATFVADLICNTAWYGMVACGGRRNAVLTGGILGALAGVGGVLLTPALGLGDAEVRRSRTTVALTVGLYLLGGVVAGLVSRSLPDDRAGY